MNYMTEEEISHPNQAEASTPSSPAEAPRTTSAPLPLVQQVRDASASALSPAPASPDEFPPEYRANAERVVQDYLQMQPGESVLFIADENPQHSDPRLIALLRAAIAQKGGRSSVFMIKPGERKSAELQQLIDSHDVLWIASDVADETLPVTFDEILEQLDAKTGKRMAHCTGVQADLLANDGALGESKSTIEQRMDAMEKRLKNVAGFHIQTALGTDLWMSMKSGRTWYKASGVIPRGSWDNLPGGEIFTTPDQRNVNGTLVLPVLHDDVTPERGVDQPVKLTIRDGKITTIEGGASAEKLRNYLFANSLLADDPQTVYTIAEIAFGANAKASKIDPGTGPDGWRQEGGPSAVVTEKRLGTIHVAFGSDNHGLEGARGENWNKNVPTHLDFVLPQEGLTVHAFRNTAAFEHAKTTDPAADNYDSLIENGDYRLIPLSPA